MSKQNGILNLDLSQPIKSDNEFRAICAIFPMIDVGNILDDLSRKLFEFVSWKRSEEARGATPHFDADFFENLMNETRNKRLSGKKELILQASAGSELKSWSTSWLPAEDGVRNINQAP